MIIVQDATYQHLREVAKNIRPADAREALGMGLTVSKALTQAFRSSFIRKVVLIDNRVAAIFGLGGTLLGYTGWPFFITTKTAETVPPITFFRLYKQEFDKIKQLYPTLEQFVDCDYTGALKLMQMVGWVIDPIKLTGLNGVSYYHLTYRSE